MGYPILFTRHRAGRGVSWLGGNVPSLTRLAGLVAFSVFSRRVDSIGKRLQIVTGLRVANPIKLLSIRNRDVATDHGEFHLGGVFDHRRKSP